MIHLVQIGNGTLRRVAVVDEPHLHCLTGVDTVYELVHRCLVNGAGLSALARSLAKGETLDYDAIYLGRSPWRLLAPIDVPGEPARLTISGTGLTHLGSAKDRQAMHTKKVEKAEAEKKDETMTDSMRMFEWGVQGGRPALNAIGVAPEWFYKGSGEMLRAPFEPLTVPAHGEDGGEEAEVAGIYVIGEDGGPVRIGMAAGNEFSDHKFEKRNYLNLAGSKLRACSVGPELVIGAEFGAIAGRVSIRRHAETFWSKVIETGEQNMCHSLANVEHHHFKFENHRRPGDVHVHFFGAHSLSFGDGVVLQDGDRMEVEFEDMGRPLINPIKIEEKETDRLVTVGALD
jgi:hypothetical protein